MSASRATRGEALPRGCAERLAPPMEQPGDKAGPPPPGRRAQVLDTVCPRYGRDLARPGAMAVTATRKRHPGTLAERFWSLAHSVDHEDSTDPEPRAVVRHVLKILDALAAGEVGDGVSQCSVS